MNTNRSIKIIMIFLLIVFLGVLILKQLSPIPIGHYYFHLRYGVYPKEVPYEEGMTIYPKQSAVVLIAIPQPP